jgi:hypothetical protein
VTLIENCKHWWRLWSVRLNAIGFALRWVLDKPDLDRLTKLTDRDPKTGRFRK